MPRLQRFNIKAMLANPDLRRKLIVDGTRAAQAREGVEVSAKDAENSYYVVTEAERGAFYNLMPFRSEAGENDGRHVEFVRGLNDLSHGARTDVTLRDFLAINSAPLAFDKLGMVASMFRDNPSLEPSVAIVRQGKATGDDGRWVRCFWEVSDKNDWVKFAKGGDFCRFYSDVYLMLDWRESSRPALRASGNALPSLEHYFKPGLTYALRTAKGFNVRVMPEGCVFGHKGPAILPNVLSDIHLLNGILNSSLCHFLISCLTSFSWEVGVVKKLPIPTRKKTETDSIGSKADSIFQLKLLWDIGNETCTRFDRPWVLHIRTNDGAPTLSDALESVLSEERVIDLKLESYYTELNALVYRLYGVDESVRMKIETAIGTRPPEVVWPQMEGKSYEQKRLEHVNRLLTYLVKRIVEADNDGLVCLQAVAQERPLLERLREELHLSFPQQDPSALETEVVNELKKKVKGCRRTETLLEWLNDAFFEIHANLYQQRPLLWHLASSQTRSVPAFSVVVHAHKFDGDALAKLRSVHIRDRLAILRREAGQARQDNREEDRLEFLAAIEEVEAFDTKLKLLQEGAHTGPEGGDRDYRILTPWKAESDRPQGWNPDLDDGIKVNIAPLARTGLLRIKGRFGEKDVED